MSIDIVDSHISDKENVVILDWDDTILPTSWLTDIHCIDQTDDTYDIKLSDFARTKLANFEQILYILFNKIAQYTQNLYIVTNSKAGWVEYSCEICFPKIMPLLSSIKIESARPTGPSGTEHRHVNWPAWKDTKFMALFGYLFVHPLSTVKKNVISIGDGMSEFNATLSMAMCRDNIVVKTIKLQEKPSIEKLHDEITFLCDCFGYIFNINKHLDVKIVDNAIEMYATETLI